MAGSYNRVILVGNLTRDPELRFVQSGNAVAKFAIAVNRRSKTGDDTTFVDIVAWDNGNYTLAQTCAAYLKRGMSVLVEGRLVIRSYDDKEGVKRKATEVVIDNMQMLDKKDGGNGQPVAARAAAPVARTTDTLDDDDFEGEIPF